ncbi:T-cell surface antigen CD2-like [Pimephales promelas]|nr:T-cell surface antigen CD2-like [Pimephales promelas]
MVHYPAGSSHGQKQCSGVSGVDPERVSVMEGDSVTLYTGVQTNQQEKIKWYYNDIRIAQIIRDQSKICTDVQCNEGTERFRDRLKLDHHTGSLNITHTTNTDSGVYTLKVISSGDSITKIFSVSVTGVFGDSVSVMEGDSVTLNTDLTEIHEDDDILWRYGAENSLIAKISIEKQNFTTYDDVPDGRFRNRLKLDNQTGSLTITHTTTEHTGVYKLEIKGVKITSKTFNVSVYGVFGDSVSVMEGDSVTLHTDLTEIHEDDDILWRYGAENSLIAKISIEKQNFTTYDDVPDGRFRNRLKLDNQTGSLTITHTTTEHTGVYKLEIKGVKITSKTFNVSVYARLPVPVIIRNSSQCSSNCSLVCSSSVLSVCDATLSWYAGMSVLSSISVCDLSISLSLPLEVEYQDKNTYSCVLNNPISNQTTHLDINTLCRHTCADQGVPLLYPVLISSGSLMIVAVVVGIFCICKKRRKAEQQETVQTLNRKVTYAHPTFPKRNAHKLNVEEEEHVEYAAVAV